MIGKFLARFAKSKKRFAKSDSGVAAVEFALVVFPFVLLLGVIIETGVMMFTEYTLQAAVQNASRLMRTGQAQSGAMNSAAFKAEICKTAGIIMNCTSGVTVYTDSAPTFAALQGKLPISTNVGVAADGTAGAASYQCGAPLEAVGVVATYDWNFIFPFMSFNANTSVTTKKRLVGIAMFANEPFPAGSTCP
jgi:Flp pilus assembly protein TadG